MKWLVRATVSGAVAVVTCLGLVSTSHAAGSCGNDLTAATACPIAISPATLGGSIAGASENDYYVFWARAHTHLSVTVTDTEDPGCSLLDDETCGGVSAALVQRNGFSPTNTLYSTPGNGVPVSQSLSHTLARGIYYLQVSGNPDTTGAPVPYALSVNGTTAPAVHWPPLCIVPRLRHAVRVSRARARLKRAFCRGGRVSRVYDRHVRRGRVVRVRPGAGAVRPYETKIHIVVSRGPRHHRR